MATDTLAEADQKMGLWAIGILLVTIVIWTAAYGSGGPEGAEVAASDPVRYVIYSLPFTLGFAYYVTFYNEAIRLDYKAVAALCVYCIVAVASMVVNSWYEFYAIRDFTIVNGYLLFFAFWFRAPPSIADAALGTLALCMMIEGAHRIGPDVSIVSSDNIYDFLGLGNSFGTSLLGSHGLLESTLGFPLGVVVLYYLYHRKWYRALIAGLLLFLAFKRISFLGVAIAVSFNFLFARTRLRVSKTVAVALASLLCAAAIFSTQIFEWMYDTFALQDSSADSVSVGRYDIALLLWDHLRRGSLLNWTIGFGPGSADSWAEGSYDLNPHNDWLKILFDYGILGMIGIHTIFYLNLVRHRLGIMIYLYSATLMMTDNVFIYMFYYPFMVLIMCAARAPGVSRQLNAVQEFT